MKCELTIIEGTRIALFRSSGLVEFEDRMRNVERMAQFCNENSIKHLIVDLSQQVSNAKLIQVFNLGTSVPKVLKGIQIGLVCQPSDRETRFEETVVANNGAFSRSFTTVKEARKWLEGEEDVTPSKRRLTARLIHNDGIEH